MKTTISNSVLYMSLTREHHAEILARRSALIMCVALTFAYIYFASASVFNAVLERTAEKNTESARTELAALGKQYYALSANVTASEGESMGLIKSSGAQFAQRTVHVSVADAPVGL